MLRMLLEPFFRWTSVVLGLIVLGETLALVFCIALLKAPSNEWLTLTNNALLVSDIITGLFLVLVPFIGDNRYRSLIIYALFFTFLPTHPYQEN